MWGVQCFDDANPLIYSDGSFDWKVISCARMIELRLRSPACFRGEPARQWHFPVESALGRRMSAIEVLKVDVQLNKLVSTDIHIGNTGS